MSSARIIAQCIVCHHRQELTVQPSPPVKCTECGHVAHVYTSRQMTPEEFERYGVTQPASRNSDGQRIKPPVARQESFTTKEDESMQVTAPSKIDFLQQIAAGKSINKVEREWNMNAGALHYWVGKWNLKGIKPDRAQQLLDEAALDKQYESPAEAQLPPAGKDGEIERLNAVIERLNKKMDHENETAARILADEIRLGKEKDAEIERLLSLVSRMTDDLRDRETKIAALNQSLVEADMRIQSLQSELGRVNESLAEWEQKAYEKATLEGTSDPVNHPAHYMAGAVECIDAIEAATTGLNGGLAYNTGAAIKYLWRWSRKNGAEDLQKARWYVDRLIDCAKGAESHEC